MPLGLVAPRADSYALAVIVRSLAAIAAVAALVAVLLSCWPSATARSGSLLPSDVAIYAPGVTSAQLAACQQLWDRTGALAPDGFTSYVAPRLLLPFLRDARRLAEVDATHDLGPASLGAISSYLDACAALHLQGTSEAPFGGTAPMHAAA